MFRISKEQTQILKGTAILLVIVGHYYRYADTTSIFSGVISSIGFLGAALFAFLSGYGVQRSYMLNGFGRNWLIRKFNKVYIPFLAVNILGIFLYGMGNGTGILRRIITGSDDFVMWYVPFILGFYLVYYCIWIFIKDFRAAFAVLSIAGVFYIIAGEELQMGSQWYTAVGALLAGVYIAQKGICEKMVKPIRIIERGGVFMVLVFLSRRFGSITAIKDWSTIFSGLVFTILITIIIIQSAWIQDKYCFILLRKTGEISYWIYLLHMKVMFLFMGNAEHKVILFVVLAAFAALIVNIIYQKIINNRQRGISKHEIKDK